MNRTLKLALGAVLGLGLVMPATAQNFPDIPDNHWAYEAIANLKGKILFGYPDGLYRPARPMSRAEFAVAINQLYQMMMAKDNQLQSALDALAQKVNSLPSGGTGGVPRAEFDALKRQVDELTNRVNGMQSWGQDIASLKRLVAEFEREIADQGIQVDAMKRDLGDMEARVSKLEGMGSGLGINISGDVNFVAIAGHSTDGLFGLSKTGRFLGVGRDDFDGVAVGMTGDTSIFHELNTTLSGEAGEGVSWKASLNFGNMLGWWDDTAFGDLNSQNAGWNIDSDNDGSLWFDELNASFDTSIAGQGFNAKVGRMYVNSGPFFYERPDYTEFYKNDRWDGGGYIVDGARFGFGFGTVNLTLWGGLTGEGLESIGGDGEGFELNNQFLDLGGDSFEVEKQIGVELGIKLGENGSLKGVYMWQDSNNVDSGMNRMNVYGGELNLDLGGIDLYAVYSQTDFGYNTNVMLNSDNAAWAGWLAYDGGNWGVDGGFARVEGNFGAFGNWGRLGTIYNPRNIEGFGGGIWINAGSRMKVSAGGAFFDGADDAPGLFGVPLTTDDSVQSFNVKLNYEINSAWGLMLGYENVDWKFDADTDPNLRWYTVGLNYAMNDRSKVSIMYMMSDADFKGNGAGLDPGAGGPFGSQDRYKGGVLSSQVSFKF